MYIETSVISYLTSRASRDLIVAGHQQITSEWWENELSKFDALISPVVSAEVSRGNPEEADKRQKMIRDMPSLAMTRDVIQLAAIYSQTAHMGDSAKNDMLHVAIAAWHGVDYLLTWNCKHIANGYVRRIVRDVNDGRGIATPVICTPEELQEF